MIRIRRFPPPPDHARILAADPLDRPTRPERRQRRARRCRGERPRRDRHRRIATSTCRCRSWASEQSHGARRLVRAGCRPTSGPRWCSARPTCAPARPPGWCSSTAGWTAPRPCAAHRRAAAREGVRHPRPPHRARHPRRSTPSCDEQRGHVGKFYFRPPGGESWCDVILRLRSLLEMMTREYARPARAGGRPPGDRQLHALPARAPGRGTASSPSTARATCPTARVTSYRAIAAEDDRRGIQARPRQLPRAAAARRRRR